MKSKAINAFKALSHEIRLEAFRLLVKKSPKAYPAGKIASALNIPGSTLTTHLQQLEQSNLLSSSREQQKILYTVNWQGAKALIAYLLEDCCGGNADIYNYTSDLLACCKTEQSRKG